MGRFDAARTGSRPIKLVFPARHFQWHCLHGWKKERIKLRGMDKYSRLWIRPSLTPLQLQAEKNRRMANNLEHIGKQMEDNNQKNSV
ncbi:unnamed protein product [Meloidogyne enterolobii]|uniref:Uncharacterized protein n=1 Tax=Meloidogyne enterolobii TaxID=390850 RepID=A0ACB0ZEN9_MELEN